MAAVSRRPFVISPGVSLSAIAWLMLWLNLNSGPWNLSDRAWPWGYLNALRAVLPCFILVLTLAAGGGAKPVPPGSGLSSLRWLQLYSLLALAAGSLSPRPAYALYFGLVHFLAIAVGVNFGRADPSLATARTWLIANLVITTVWATGVIFVGRHIIFGAGASAYGIYNELEEVAGMPMSRSSGIARFAAVPLIGAATLAWREKGWRRAIWVAAAGLFAFVVYRMQSRGALAGASAALAWLCLLAPRRRWPTRLLALTAVVLAFQPHARRAIYEYAIRGQDIEELRSLTGRTEVWRSAGDALWISPVFGSGHFADRLLLGANVHNALLSAWLTAGIAGLLPFLLSWVCAGRDWWRLWHARHDFPPRDQNYFLISGALLVFFTIRSIPETTTAGFSADLLILLPVLAYLGRAASMVASPLRADAANAKRIGPDARVGGQPGTTSADKTHRP